jgi:hypothetical protein
MDNSAPPLRAISAPGPDPSTLTGFGMVPRWFTSRADVPAKVKVLIAGLAGLCFDGRTTRASLEEVAEACGWVDADGNPLRYHASRAFTKAIKLKLVHRDWDPRARGHLKITTLLIDLKGKDQTADPGPAPAWKVVGAPRPLNTRAKGSKRQRSEPLAQAPGADSASAEGPSSRVLQTYLDLHSDDDQTACEHAKTENASSSSEESTTQETRESAPQLGEALEAPQSGPDDSDVRKAAPPPATRPDAIQGPQAAGGFGLADLTAEAERYWPNQPGLVDRVRGMVARAGVWAREGGLPDAIRVVRCGMYVAHSQGKSPGLVFTKLDEWAASGFDAETVEFESGFKRPAKVDKTPPPPSWRPPPAEDFAPPPEDVRRALETAEAGNLGWARAGVLDCLERAERHGVGDRRAVAAALERLRNDEGAPRRQAVAPLVRGHYLQPREV